MTRIQHHLAIRLWFSAKHFKGKINILCFISKLNTSRQTHALQQTHCISPLVSLNSRHSKLKAMLQQIETWCTPVVPQQLTLILLREPSGRALKLNWSFIRLISWELWFFACPLQCHCCANTASDASRINKIRLILSPVYVFCHQDLNKQSLYTKGQLWTVLEMLFFPLGFLLLSKKETLKAALTS